MMKENQAKLLIQKYLSGNCTETEKALIETWYLQQNLDHHLDLTEEEQLSDLKEVSSRLEEEYHPTRRMFKWSQIAAAIVIFFIGAGLYFYKNNAKKQVNNIEKQFVKDIKPGGNKAILTLANGKKISLDDAKDGELAKQSGILITKTADGKLVYTITDPRSSNTNLNAYNMIETPRGGQYQINLPDGTKVWLNAASSLRYPTCFLGSKREVSLKGEAYFEVAKDKTKPFRVISDLQTVEVLGTHFNINAYNDEASTKTTLLEGSVKVKSKKTDRHLILEPGNQSVLANKSLFKKNVDVEEAVAWKNGQFMFVNESLESIMRKLARWYNVDVNYESGIASSTFTGTISKYKNVSEVLATLELTNSVHFKIKDKTITVTE
ncbi:FecR family protein [Pedobacter sp. SD-b]|uniref:FecR family protein n=1 Tax=Pedobacter segetis TaxID=2793069 RepID=A0ABS1BL77_9SPHI|nr:FecR family protein [Pedobacter segetis]MBK0383645.1 FecR family protein [Pedobacter segetis]